MALTKTQAYEVGFNYLTNSETLWLFHKVAIWVWEKTEVSTEQIEKYCDIFKRIVEKKEITGKEAQEIKRFIMSDAFLEALWNNIHWLNIPSEIQSSNPQATFMLLREIFLNLLLNARLNKSLSDGKVTTIQQQVRENIMTIALAIGPNGVVDIMPNMPSRKVLTRSFIQIEGENYEIERQGIKNENDEFLLAKRVLDGTKSLFVKKDTDYEMVLTNKKTLHVEATGNGDFLCIFSDDLNGAQYVWVYNWTKKSQTLHVPLPKNGKLAGMLSVDKFILKGEGDEWSIYEASSGRLLRTLNNVEIITIWNDASEIVPFRDENGYWLYNAKEDTIVSQEDDEYKLSVKFLRAVNTVSKEVTYHHLETSESYSMVRETKVAENIQMVVLKNKNGEEETHCIYDAEVYQEQPNERELYDRLTDVGTKVDSVIQTPHASFYKMWSIVYMKTQDSSYIFTQWTVRINETTWVLWISTPENGEYFLDLKKTKKIDPNSILYRFSKGLKDPTNYTTILD